MDIEVPETFKPHLDATLVRFQYLYPKVKVTVQGSTISLSNLSPELYSEADLKQEFFHLLFKEKIYLETIEIRTALYKAIAK